MKKKLHILVIIIGTIFVSLSAFHENIWFDESYSVALAEKSFGEIWTIGGNDVHPILYYWMLHIINLIFGKNLIAYRLFSVLGVLILGIIGFTHIRKDFGEKAGIIFSYLAFFLPVISLYAAEIRMYTWVATFVVIAGIYAYRIKNKNTWKNWIIFGIFSLASCYTHYYGLMAAGLMNLGLFIYSIIKKDKKMLTKFVAIAVVQIALYMPWMICFIKQVTQVSSGFWITLKFPDVLIQSFNFQYILQGEERIGLNNQTIFTLLLIGIFYIYLASLMKKTKEERIPVICAIVLYVAVILAALIISIAVTPILYSRYIFAITGLIIFAISIMLSKEENMKKIAIVLISITTLACINEIKLIVQNYDKQNMQPVEYIEERLREGDIIIYNKIGAGSTFAIFLNNNQQYFVNLENWNVEEAYKAYGPQMETVRDFNFLENYKGRIWLVHENNAEEFYEKMPKDNIKIIEEKIDFETKYHNNKYSIMCVEKN